MMSAKSKVALAVAIVLGTASASMSAPRHPVHSLHHRHHAVVKQHVPPSSSYAYQRFGHVYVREPGYMEFQTRGIIEGEGD
jgi:hypothetical protein